MPTLWSSRPPQDCPFPPSEDLRSISFTGRRADYTNADTWYPSWGSDDVLYTPWTDGSFGERKVPFDCSSKATDVSNDGRDGKAGTGNARILGNDPLDLTLENLGVEYASPAPYGGRYPCGSLMHNGIWYYGTYCLDESGRTSEDGRPLNWDILGPFDAQLRERTAFIPPFPRGLPDGSCLDAEGFIWNCRVAGGGCLVRFAPDGRIDRVLDLPCTSPTSCTFGGADLQTLYVTSARFGLSFDHLEAHPHEGGLFCASVGVGGLPARRFGQPASQQGIG